MEQHEAENPMGFGELHVLLHGCGEGCVCVGGGGGEGCVCVCVCVCVEWEGRLREAVRSQILKLLLQYTHTWY